MFHCLRHDKFQVGLQYLLRKKPFSDWKHIWFVLTLLSIAFVNNRETIVGIEASNDTY